MLVWLWQRGGGGGGGESVTDREGGGRECVSLTVAERSLVDCAWWQRSSSSADDADWAQKTCVGGCLKWESCCTGAIPLSWPWMLGSSGMTKHHTWRTPLGWDVKQPPNKQTPKSAGKLRCVK